MILFRIFHHGMVFGLNLRGCGVLFVNKFLPCRLLTMTNRVVRPSHIIAFLENDEVLLAGFFEMG